MDDTGLTVVRHGMRAVRVPIGTVCFKWYFSQEVVNGKPAKLVGALVPMEDAQASFQISRLFASSRPSHFFCTVPPSITYRAAPDYDNLVQ